MVMAMISGDKVTKGDKSFKLSWFGSLPDSLMLISVAQCSVLDVSAITQIFATMIVTKNGDTRNLSVIVSVSRIFSL